MATQARASSAVAKSYGGQAYWALSAWACQTEALCEGWSSERSERAVNNALEIGYQRPDVGRQIADLSRLALPDLRRLISVCLVFTFSL